MNRKRCVAGVTRASDRHGTDVDQRVSSRRRAPPHLRLRERRQPRLSPSRTPLAPRSTYPRTPGPVRRSRLRRTPLRGSTPTQSLTPGRPAELPLRRLRQLRGSAAARPPGRRLGTPLDRERRAREPERLRPSVEVPCKGGTLGQSLPPP